MEAHDCIPVWELLFSALPIIHKKHLGLCFGGPQEAALGLILLKGSENSAHERCLRLFLTNFLTMTRGGEGRPEKSKAALEALHRFLTHYPARVQDSQSP